MTEDEPHPLSRMATIRNPSFWVFFSACVVLYAYNKPVASAANDMARYSRYGNYVCLAGFVGLFLTLVAGSIKNPGLSRFFIIFCYVFEVASVAWLGILIVIH